ncbi:MAG: carbohydrate ABC transporter permease, partial [Spirochaetales bacterium]|nr:carbohydrate ABC transporter permease [Spirochaetales bacterium]
MSTLQSKQRLKQIFDVLTFFTLFLLGALVLLPIWWMFRSSLMTNAELYAFPPAFFPGKWLFSNYVATLQF